MIPYQKKTIDTRLAFRRMEIVINGDASQGQRTIQVRIPVVDENGKWLEDFVTTATGAEFNTLYEAYVSDIGLIYAINPKLDLSNMPVNLTNEEIQNGQESSVGVIDEGNGDVAVEPAGSSSGDTGSGDVEAGSGEAV